MRTTFITLTLICTMALASCSGKGNGKDGYTINDLYQTENKDILNGPRMAGLISFCQGEDVYYGTERNMRVVSDGKYLHPYSYSARHLMEYNRNEIDLSLLLDGLKYANVSKPIEEGDWFYMTYVPADARFYFYYVDLAELPADD